LKVTHYHQQALHQKHPLLSNSSPIKQNNLESSTKSGQSSASLQFANSPVTSSDEKIRSDYENFKKKVILSKNSRDPTEQSEDNEATKKPLQFLLQKKILPREFFTVDPVVLAKKLLGKIIVRKNGNQIIRCKIVETEAYCGGQDKGSHAFGGRMTERTKHIYQEGGHLYVYLIYGLSYCMCFTARFKGEPGAVLIRAVEVLEGLDHVIANRNVKNLSKLGKELVNGPGKLCAALKIDRSHNAHDVTKDSDIYVIEGDNKPFEVVVSKRINIDYAEEYKDKPWRFYIKDNLYVSCKGAILEITTSPAEKTFTQAETNEQISQISFVESLEKYRAPSALSKISFLK